MLTHPAGEGRAYFTELRRREFARLDREDVAYLDYAGAALYAESQVAAHGELLARSVFGNPHADHAASRASTEAIDAARRRMLRFLDAGDDYAVCFTANTSAAIKLVAEAYPFGAGAPCVLTADNHNSVNGVREFARRAGAAIVYLPLRDDLRLDHPEARLAGAGGGGLFAFPAQSNFSGVHHPLSLVRSAQSLGYHVLLDAAAFVPTHPLSLRACPADFVALSAYKVFGYPCGVGALVARREALDSLARPWFAGGTIDHASVALPRHQLRRGAAAFEDGTPNFLDIAALEPGFAFREALGPLRVTSHVMDLTKQWLDSLAALRHRDGAPLVRVYAAPGARTASLSDRGATVAFNVLDRDGRTVPYELVEHRASAARVHLRGGCFCNPGAAEAAFRLDPARLSRCLDSLDHGFSVNGLRGCLGPDAAIGALRASFGIATEPRDLQRAVDVIASFGA
jgi:selenocysteine lyase/cysteine desulfurase